MSAAPPAQHIVPAPHGGEHALPPAPPVPDDVDAPPAPLDAVEEPPVPLVVVDPPVPLVVDAELAPPEPLDPPDSLLPHAAPRAATRKAIAYEKKALMRTA